MIDWLQKVNFGKKCTHFDEVVEIEKKAKMTFSHHSIFLYYR